MNIQFAAGWGRVSEEGEPSKVLLQVQVPIISNEGENKMNAKKKSS